MSRGMFGGSWILANKATNILLEVLPQVMLASPRTLNPKPPSSDLSPFRGCLRISLGNLCSVKSN